MSDGVLGGTSRAKGIEPIRKETVIAAEQQPGEEL